MTDGSWCACVWQGEDPRLVDMLVNTDIVNSAAFIAKLRTLLAAIPNDADDADDDSDDD